MGCPLEDFGQSAASVVPARRAADVPSDGYDDGYNAGWDDAIAQVERDQTRVSEQLANCLLDLHQEHCGAMVGLIDSLEPALRDLFDKVLPHAAEKAFLPGLVEDLRGILETGAEQLTLAVPPEDVPALTRLLERADITESQAVVTSEPALAMSQALIRWTGQERRIDLDGVLAGIDSSLDTFLATLDRGQNAADLPELKEAKNG